MRTIAKLLASYLYCGAICTSYANSVAFTTPADPSISWSDYPNGIAVATSLTPNPGNLSGGELKIYIKNTSATEKVFYPNGFDSGIRIFYQTATGMIVPLHAYSLDQGISTARVRGARIKPGEILCVTIDLNIEEFQFLKTFPSKYEFSVLDPIGRKHFNIDSATKQLAN